MNNPRGLSSLQPAHVPTGERYPAATIRQIALVPNDRGQRDRLMAELPYMLDQAKEMDEALPVHAAAIVAKRPWWAFWLTQKVCERMMRNQMDTKTVFEDNGRNTVTMLLQAGPSKDRLETVHLHTERIAMPEPMLSLFYVQLEGTAEGEEGDVFWSCAFGTDESDDPAHLLVEAAKEEALESGQFHSGRVLRCYGPLVAMHPIAEMAG